MSHFNLMAFYKHIKTDWKLILAFILMITALMLFVALTTPNKYRSIVVLAPSESSASSGLSSLASQFGGVASLAGVNLGGGGADKTIEALEVLKSKEFLNYFIKKYNLKVTIIGVKGWDIYNDRPVYHEDYNPVTKKWSRDVKFPKTDEPSLYEVSEFFLKNNLNIMTVAETGYTNLEVLHFSPKIAAEITNNLILEINKKIRVRDIDSANKAIAFLEKTLSQTKVEALKQQIYQMIEHQINTKMMAEVKADYVFKVIDAPYEAEERHSPNRVVLILLGIFLGCFLGVVISLFRFVRNEIIRVGL